ncbi:hypothetical protein BJY01DRAFT_251666 [Aspergillus pseudoustus]|uniref:Uncharacterized protein n=1 Tax=Aspergillus pseudoustus TaxID=1810923 RepID=A0ABR4JAL0_9EURO
MGFKSSSRSIALLFSFPEIVSSCRLYAFISLLNVNVPEESASTIIYSDHESETIYETQLTILPQLNTVPGQTVPNTGHQPTTPEKYAETVKMPRRQGWKKNQTSAGEPGTVDEPIIEWTTTIPGKLGYKEGHESVCREACKLTRSTKVWLRSMAHRTTRKPGTKSGMYSNKSDSFEEDDFHITVYMGTPEEYDFEGHLVCTPSENDPRLPARLVTGKDRGSADEPWSAPLNDKFSDRRPLRHEAIDRGLL